MSSEFEADAPELKDRTPYVWLGVLLAIGVMILILWAAGSRPRNISNVRVRHILIRASERDPAGRARAYERIQELRQRISDGESFAKVAREWSDDPVSAPRGGDLGYFLRGSFEGPFEEAAWTLPLNQLSDVIQTSRGFHIIEVLDRSLSDIDRHAEELRRRAEEQQRADETAAPKDPDTTP